MALVLLRDDGVGRRLRWDGVQRAIAQTEQDVGGNEVVPLLPRVPAQEKERNGEEASSYFAAEVAESSDEGPWQRWKWRVE